MVPAPLRREVLPPREARRGPRGSASEEERARAVMVWAIGKDDRATFASWLSAARADCEKLPAGKDEQEVA